MASYPSFVKIVEVGPRDGLQSLNQTISTEDKIRYIDLLSKCSFPEIEVTSFVSPKWIPQLADADEVSHSILHAPNTVYTALIPNLTGLENALDAGYNSVAVFTTVSETFSQNNTNCSINESMKRFSEMELVWKEINLRVRGYISTVWHCPYEGKINHKKVIDMISKLIDLGITEISLGDTIGRAKPGEVRKLLEIILSKWAPSLFALHMHDTFGFAKENIRAGLELGVYKFDSSTGGMGGCPYAEGSSGNIATETLHSLCQSLGIETGIQSKSLIQAAEFIQNTVEKESITHA